MRATMKSVLIIFVLQILRSSDADDSSTSLPAISTTTENPGEFSFLLFTRENRTGTRVLVGQTDIPMKKGLKTVFVVHGFVSRPNQTLFNDLFNAWLDLEDVNIFSVDWTEEAFSNGLEILDPLAYSKAISSVPIIGEKLGRYTVWLQEEEMTSIDKMILVGHSLGAHVCGFAGKTIKKIRDLVYKQIIGLDPAGPGYRLKSCSETLCSIDAEFVQIFHTSESLGLLRPLGACDYYFNGGKIQPGCYYVTCSHWRAIEYLTSSLRQNCQFIGTPWESYIGGTISTSECTNKTCSAPGLSAQYFIARGSFMVKTNSAEPFCQSNTVTLVP